MVLEKIMIERCDGEMQASTWDSNGASIPYEMSPAEIDFCGEMLSRARALRPAWDREKIRLEEEKAAEIEAKEQAVAARQAAEQREAATAEKIKAINAEMIKIISGGTAQATSELIALYAPWSAGMSVDAGDAYQDGGVIYVSGKDHITSEATRPGTSGGNGYWYGGIHGDGTTQPTPGATTTYTKGQVILWMGVHYRALVDTNNEPGDAPEEWGLASNDD